MLPEDIDLIRRTVPEAIQLDYYAGREHPWMLAQLMAGDARIADLRAGPLAKFLTRPLVRDVAALSGDGRLRHMDVLAAGDAARADAIPGITAAGFAALDRVYASAWHDYLVTFAAWGTGPDDWRWGQMSRPGGNLVIQIGFPSDHGPLFGQYLGVKDRSRFEFPGHPVRTTGRPTLAWVRVDIDLARGIALIEEVQSDWIRFVEEEIEWIAGAQPRSRELRTLQAYRTRLVARYGREWAGVAMLAALIVLRDEIGVHQVYMHTYGGGQRLKSCGGPRSLYERLPKSFGFRAVQDAPPFLERVRRKDLGRMRRGDAPAFWRLSFGQGGAA
ncbi:MAG: hypothetical protein AAGK37_08925 [Pseudomonadota bacterium]